MAGSPRDLASLEAAIEREQDAKQRRRAARTEQDLMDAENALYAAQRARYTLEHGCSGCGHWRARYERECRFSAGYAAALAEAQQQFPRALQQAAELIRLEPALRWR